MKPPGHLHGDQSTAIPSDDADLRGIDTGLLGKPFHPMPGIDDDILVGEIRSNHAIGNTGTTDSSVIEPKRSDSSSSQSIRPNGLVTVIIGPVISIPTTLTGNQNDGWILVAPGGHRERRRQLMSDRVDNDLFSRFVRHGPDRILGTREMDRVRSRLSLKHERRC